VFLNCVSKLTYLHPGQLSWTVSDVSKRICKRVRQVVSRSWNVDFFWHPQEASNVLPTLPSYYIQIYLKNLEMMAAFSISRLVDIEIQVRWHEGWLLDYL
jgi:hypothetical protein